MRLLPFTTAALLGAALVFGGIADPMAGASVIGEREPGTFIEYEGTVSIVHMGDGDTNVIEPEAATVGIECDETGCALFGFFIVGHGGGPFPIDGGSATIELPGVVADCDDNAQRAATLEVAATATSMRVVATTPESGWMECDDGQLLRWGTVSTFDGTFSAGDSCVLDGAACPEQEPVAETETEVIPLPAPQRSPSDPSVLSTLRSPAAITVPEVLLAAALTVVLVILVAFPTQLFNSTSERASTAIAAWWRRIRKRPAEAPVPTATPAGTTRRSGWAIAAGGVAAASLISAFVDPRFALDATSIRSFFSIFIALVLEVCVSWLVLIWLVRKTHPTATATFEFKPQSLLIVVAAVVLSRLSGFEPGMVFGLVAGVTFGAVLATADRAKVALVGLAWSFGVAILAWIAYGAMSLLVTDAESFWLTFLHETLASLTIAGIAALPIALFPFRGLTGFTVFEWNRWVWALTYLVGLLAFFLVLLPFPASWSGVSLSFATWIGLYLAYAAAAVLTWLLVTKPWRPGATPADPAGLADELA